MIAQKELEQVNEYVKNHGLSEQVISELRASFTGKHFTWCSEDDIHVGKPVLEEASFAIYLVNSADHCSVLTNDLGSASGFVIAEKVED